MGNTHYFVVYYCICDLATLGQQWKPPHHRAHAHFGTFLRVGQGYCHVWQLVRDSKKTLKESKLLTKWRVFQVNSACINGWTFELPQSANRQAFGRRLILFGRLYLPACLFHIIQVVYIFEWKKYLSPRKNYLLLGAKKEWLIFNFFLEMVFYHFLLFSCGKYTETDPTVWKLIILVTYFERCWFCIILAWNLNLKRLMQLLFSTYESKLSISLNAHFAKNTRESSWRVLSWCNAHILLFIDMSRG